MSWARLIMLVSILAYLPGSAFAKSDRIAELWAFIAARQANIVLCMRKYSKARASLAPIHEEIVIEDSRRFADIKSHYRAQGRSEHEIRQVENRLRDMVARRVSDDAKHRLNDFIKLCRAIPKTYHAGTYMFRPLVRLFPDVIPYLNKYR